MIKLYFSTVKILAQRPTHVSAVATVLHGRTSVEGKSAVVEGERGRERARRGGRERGREGRRERMRE